LQFRRKLFQAGAFAWHGQLHGFQLVAMPVGAGIEGTKLATLQGKKRQAEQREN
jgi:hypothetical protein